MHRDNEEVAMNKPQRPERQTGKAFFKVRYTSSKPERAFSIYYTQVKIAFLGVEIVWITDMTPLVCLR